MAGNKTKLKFAQVVQELMEEKSLRKITVNDIVEKSHMTRQAFYYHFHDIYELLEWTCAYELFREEPEPATMKAWILALIDHMQDNRKFYRKIYLEFDERLLEQLLKEEFKKEIRREFFRRNPTDSKWGKEEERDFLRDFLASSCANYLQKWICGYHSGTKEIMAQHMIFLMEYMWNGYYATEKEKKSMKIIAGKYA
ncbi:TetR/AcrR family transcriptional regulator C-terminal domain-containing protein [Roseburia hominis]